MFAPSYAYYRCTSTVYTKYSPPKKNTHLILHIWPVHSHTFNCTSIIWLGMPHTVLAQASVTWICFFFFFFLLLHIRVNEKENRARITKEIRLCTTLYTHAFPADALICHGSTVILHFVKKKKKGLGPGGKLTTTAHTPASPYNLYNPTNL